MLDDPTQVTPSIFFLGVDIAGASNTWVCELAERTSDGRLSAETPAKATLVDIVSRAEAVDAAGVAIDAQLTCALSEEKGFRSSDDELRRRLPRDCINWVASQNSLMAVPVRGRQLAEALSPIVGTIIETHPRACLLFLLPGMSDDVKAYKKDDGEAATKRLWDAVTTRFMIQVPILNKVTDGMLDALVCALVAWLYHRQPADLEHLPHTAADKRGRGPFYMMRESVST